MEFSSDTGASGFALEPAAEGGVQGELWGALEEGVLAQLQASLRALDTAGHSRRRLLLLRLRRVTQCGPAARARWVALHRWLSQERWRTAYLDPRPWGRGQVLAVVHRAGDALALAVGQEPRARAGVFALRKTSKLVEGYEVAFLEEALRTFGLRGFLRWMRVSAEVWGELVQRYGERDAHLVAAFASLWNGCAYCAHGHLLAFNLHVFEAGHGLTGLDEARLPALMVSTDAEVLAELERQLAAPHFARARGLVQRQYALQSGVASLEQEDDVLLRRTGALYAWVNECSITVEPPAPPLGRIARKQPLRQHYERARARRRG